MEKIAVFFNKLSRPAVIIIGFLLVVLLGVIDYATGKEISFSIFYLAPIILVAWYAGAAPAILVSFAGAATWFGADWLAGSTYSHFLIPCWNALMRLGFFIIIVFLLSKLKNVLERERAMSRTDALTGVANNRYFDEIATNEIIRLKRYGRVFSVAYLDLDNFKYVNDVWGHSMGNALLSSAARGFKNDTRLIDTVARVGGDEFIILMPETDAENVRGVLVRIKENFDELMRKNQWPVTISIGVVTFTVSPLNSDELIGIVDNLMYRVKSSGKNSIRYEVLKR